MSLRIRMILIGGIVGAVVGATGAWAYQQAQQSKREERTSQLSLPPDHLQLAAAPSDYVKVAVSLVLLVRQVVDLFKPAERKA